MKLKLLLPLLLSGAISVYGQVNLSGMVPESADSLQKCKIRYFSPGRGGMNRVWDFSKKLGSKESSQVMFMKDSTGMVSVIETGNITYDWNNNPKQIYFTNGSVTKYVYSALGQKLRVVHYTAKPNISRTWGVKPAELTAAQILQADSTDYLMNGSLTMKNGKIDKYLFEGGYAQASVANSTTDNFAFYYYNQDHLGNIREVVNSSGTVQQVTNYYPFGTPYADTSAAINPDFQPYKYSGKELDKMHGLNTYDHGARQYDPILLRWDRIDQLCEKYYPLNPYNYCGNSPVRNIDPDGRKIVLGSNSSPVFIEQYNVAVQYLKDSNAAEVWQKLDAREEQITVYENAECANYTSGNDVFWNPLSGLCTSSGAEGHKLSPAIRLLHELGHKLQELTGEYDTTPDNSEWQSKEEKRNILEVETPAAVACGEIPENSISRDSHSGVPFTTDSPKSTIIKNPEDPQVKLWRMCFE